MEKRVAHVQDFSDGQMQQIAVEGIDLLLAKVNNKFYAIGAHCSHYGAPLAQGVLKDNRLICPWHNACFDVTTGNQLEPPGLDALPQFEVRVENDAVIVRVPESAAQRTPDMATHQSDADPRTFVILGAGAAGSTAAETLRQQGFQGRVVMITRDRDLPYDRTLLSKSYLQGQAELAPLRSADFYQQADIEVQTGQTVTQVETVSQTLTFAEGSTLKYDELLLATGGKARRLPVPGADLGQIFTLRCSTDAEQILAAAEAAQHIVIVGSSFIGMEAAASLAQAERSITVISRASVPFEKTLGPELGQMFQQVHEANGIQFRLDTQVERLEGRHQVEGIVLASGEHLPADLVILGLGVEPVTDYLSDIDLNGDRSVPVNEYLQGADHLYTAGDIAQFPDSRTGQPSRIEHWRLAAQQGRIAARNMLGQNIAFKGIPFFWTGQFDLKLRYAGHAEDWDQVILQGNLSKHEFLAFYVQANRVVAVASCGCDREMAAITELMRLDQFPSPEMIQNQSIDWLTHLQKQPIC